ncbi:MULTISPECIES: TetR/AcrR family transcriptional regulator [unclassified Ensifer]|uniref:TetR/AcrR family transcriptional regulator n=1 Tax=unclassified Ensifer TaxID=2633371 RepID=UPI000813B727|nr:MULTISPECIES: TetR/AcrR family transcriptional regulator [unclassified Ensifer]OCP18369.1 TetR family transcriptional regulator [Ensifer sp. LC54]OCP27459.1 TetR family transcriptional regulator [Ensifer sp. LC384]
MSERPTSSHRRVNDPEGLRQRLVDAAYAAFSTRGYHSSGLHDLKRDADVTGGALAHHFPTKKALGLAVIQDRVAEAVELTWITPVNLATTTADGIQAVFAAIISELERKGAVSGCPLNNLALELSREDEDFQAAIEAIFIRWRTAIAEKLRADLRAAPVRDFDSEAMATLVVATYSGAMAMAKASQSVTPLKICAEQLTSIIRTQTSLGHEL